MFERFTDRARRVVVLAQEESQLLSHNYIGTEHLLLGLLAEQDGIAARALESLNVTLDAARQQVEEIIGPGEQTPSGHIPFTPRAKKILELSLREALIMRSGVIDTQHLVLGLIDEGDGVGAQILQRLGATPQAVREAVARLVNAEPEITEAAVLHEPESGPRAVSVTRQVRLRPEALTEVKDLLVGIDRRLSAIEGHLAAIEGHLGIDAGQEEPPAGAAETETETEAE
jgi:ATP-dependent Clp protease ATP-binding subunit ClpC